MVAPVSQPPQANSSKVPQPDLHLEEEAGNEEFFEEEDSFEEEDDDVYALEDMLSAGLIKSPFSQKRSWWRIPRVAPGAQQPTESKSPSIVN